MRNEKHFCTQCRYAELRYGKLRAPHNTVTYPGPYDHSPCLNPVFQETHTTAFGYETSVRACIDINRNGDCKHFSPGKPKVVVSPYH